MPKVGVAGHTARIRGRARQGHQVRDQSPRWSSNSGHNFSEAFNGHFLTSVLPGQIPGLLRRGRWPKRMPESSAGSRRPTPPALAISAP